MSEPETKYWFPAKRYGWGWGPPATWQGWLALVVWVAAVTAASLVTMLPTPRWGLFAGSIVVLLAVIILVCWMKGEPPRWRWGEA